MNDVVFIKQQGGLGRALPGSDYLSAMLFYTNNLPTGFTTSLNKKQVFQVSDAETLGIVDTYTDETQATGTFVISTKGATGDTVTFTIAQPLVSATGVVGTTNVVLGTYTVGSADTTIALQGAALAAVINANTYTTGYSASFATATLTIKAATGTGTSLNTGTPISVVITAAAPGSILTATKGSGGSGYVAGDTGTISAGSTLATYVVQTVTAGAVTTFQITSGGAGYTVATGIATATGGAQPGTGTGFTVNVTTLGPDFAGAITQFSGSVYSQLALWHYHISEYFRLNPTGNLWLGFYPTPGSYTFSELQDLQQFAGGTIRQCLIYNIAGRTAAQVVSDCTAIQASEAILEGLHMPLSVIYAPNIAAISNLATLTNLGLLSANKVSVSIGQDGGGAGALLFLTTGISVTTGGALLGAVSSAPVNVDIAWVANYNISNGVEDNIIAFSNGQLYTAISTNLLNQLDAYRYIFLRTFVDFTGSFFNDSHCAIAESSDYAYIENNRTIDKAIRVGRAALLPLLNSPILVNADGTITGNSIAVFRGALQTAADPMIRAGEISADGITISPTQQILSTSNFYIGFQIVPTGTARNIKVNIGFAQSVTNG